MNNDDNIPLLDLTENDELELKLDADAFMARYDIPDFVATFKSGITLDIMQSRAAANSTFHKLKGIHTITLENNATVMASKLPHVRIGTIENTPLGTFALFLVSKVEHDDLYACLLYTSRCV